MKIFKYLTVIALSFAMILSKSNRCSAVWFPKKTEVIDFLKRENISFQGIHQDVIGTFISGKRSHSPVIDFILRSDLTKKQDMVNFARENWNCKSCSCISDDRIIDLITNAAKEFCSKHSDALDAISRFKDVTSSLGRKITSDERLAAETEVKKLFLYVVVLEDFKNLEESNKIVATREIDKLLGNVFTKIEKEVAEKNAEAIESKVDSVDARLDDLAIKVHDLEEHNKAQDEAIDGLSEVTKEQGKKIDGLSKDVEDIYWRLDQIEERMKHFETIDNEIIKQVPELVRSISVNLQETGKVDGRKYDELMGIFSKLATELAENRNLSERFEELSNRVRNIRIIARQASEKGDKLFGMVRETDKGVQAMRSTLDRQSDRIVGLEHQGGDVLSNLAKIMADVQVVDVKYRTYVREYVQNCFAGRDRDLREAYKRAGFWQQSRMRDAYPNIQFEEEGK